MERLIPQFPRRRIAAAVSFGIALLGLFALAGPAYARVFVSFGFPFFLPLPLYYPPPVYYYPPAVYAPPPAYYPPPPASYAPSSPPAGPSGQSCYAGAYMCPMDIPVAPGAACYCLGNQGTHVWGNAH